ncbi:MAG: hypothetical protein GY830_08495 [Bacteroidetes bacterium]|nr:hypothetical protein [Bacteroidota bacterium]
MIILRFFAKIFFLLASMFCRLILKIFWKKVDELPYGIDKGVMLLAPHTSSWDGFWGIFYALSFFNYNRKIRMAFREESNTTIMGPILKFFGAVFIDRYNVKDKGINTINLFVNELKEHNRVYVAIFAEGTRAPTENFNPGFYYIAYKAKVPILTLKFDYKNSYMQSGPIIFPSGSYKKDLPIWENFYKNTKGKKPENFKVFQN